MPLSPYKGVHMLQIKSLYPHFYHKVDIHGRPVYYELIGELQLAELLKHVCLDRLVKLHVLHWENTRKEIFPACSRQVGKEIFTCTCVLDLKGIRINSFTKDVREFISRVASIDQVRAHQISH
jgi:hypothetical protein